MDAEITTHVTEDLRQRIESLANEYGVDVDELVRRVLVDFVEGEADPEPDSDDEDEDVDVQEEFRQSWRESLAGNVIPLEDLWKELDDD